MEVLGDVVDPDDVEPVGAQAPQAVLDRRDLDGRPWIAVEEPGDPVWRDTFVAACVASGFTPDIRLDAADPLTALGLVASGLGPALGQKSMVRGATDAVAVRTLPWHEASVHLWAVWHHVDLRPVVASFRETVLSDEREPGAGHWPVGWPRECEVSRGARTSESGVTKRQGVMPPRAPRPRPGW
ncbi:LysR substrate-binding domain-containing protein [Streptomyces sp. WAC05858]|uniref:LysR substrate-binding domain-containing protein n=1 Tax=Streptomyces TaxID=1883 RepID=UPI0021AF7087